MEYCRDINDFKKVHQPGNNIVQVRRISSLQTPTVICLFGGTIFLKVIEGFRAEINTAETLVRRNSAFEFETAIEKLKEHRSPGID